MSTPNEPAPDDPRVDDERLHAHRLTLFSVSAGMVGVCLTAVGLIGVLKGLAQTETFIDELLTFDALLFLLGTGFYFALLRRGRRRACTRWLDHVADATFFLALALLLAACVAFTMEFHVPGPQAN